ncbi:unnamed protein product [Lathyrus sativus]|nr:unnamed protein product [Lathyrus sativus]
MSFLTSASSTFFFLSITTLLCFSGTTKPDTPCPYPCYPPPLGSGTVTPTNPTPSVSTVPPAPPQSGVLSYPPPSGYYPYNPTPPYGGNNNGGGGGGGVYGTPPPPDPILPYFPFYYKNPPNKPDDSPASSITKGKKFMGMIFTTIMLSLFLVSGFV